MDARRERDPLIVIHCHGCDCGVLVQESHDCPKCGHFNRTNQTIRDDYTCAACGRVVAEFTGSADAEFTRRLAS